VRGLPVASSHFLPGTAPQVGQRTVSICFRLSSFFMGARADCTPNSALLRRVTYSTSTILHDLTSTSTGVSESFNNTNESITAGVSMYSDMSWALIPA
jgi:hypothetical protein